MPPEAGALLVGTHLHWPPPLSRGLVLRMTGEEVEANSSALTSLTLPRGRRPKAA